MQLRCRRPANRHFEKKSCINNVYITTFQIVTYFFLRKTLVKIAISIVSFFLNAMFLTFGLWKIKFFLKRC